MRSGGTDTNYFRYCGEYWDTETETYYLRARYYDPALGRFTQEDTHWNTANMIYGDNPQKINEREDRLGLKSYSYAPQISAIMQSGNLYVYCVNSPVAYSDNSGGHAQRVQSLRNDNIPPEMLLFGAAASAVGLAVTAAVRVAVSTDGVAVTAVAVAHEARRKIPSETKISPLVVPNVYRFNDNAPRDHHIVARTDHRAKISQGILENAKIPIESPFNHVIIRQVTHKGMHTTAYFKYVDMRLTTAVENFNPETIEYQNAVITTLISLQLEIIMLDTLNIAAWL